MSDAASSHEPADPDCASKGKAAAGGAGSIQRGELVGRPDLAPDSIEDLRQRQRALKISTRQVKKELKNKRRQKQRIVRRVASLGTQDIVQVLLDRGVQLRDAQAAADAQAVVGKEDGAGASDSKEAEQARVLDAGSGIGNGVRAREDSPFHANGDAE